MTIAEAKEILSRIKERSADLEFTNRLDSLISDLSKLFGDLDEVNEGIAEQISFGDSSISGVDYNWVMNLNKAFLQIKFSSDYEKQFKDSRNKVVEFNNNRSGLKLQREKAVKKNAKAKNITFWITISLVLAGIVTICIFALVQWIQKGKGIIDEPNWDMMSLAGILDAFVGGVGFGIERFLDHSTSKEIREIDKQENEMCENLYGDLFVQNNGDGSTGYQDCTIYNITNEEVR